MTPTPHHPPETTSLAQTIGTFAAGIRAEADCRAEQAGAIAVIHALILATIARLVARFEQVFALWLAGALPSLSPRSHSRPCKTAPGASARLHRNGPPCGPQRRTPTRNLPDLQPPSLARTTSTRAMGVHLHARPNAPASRPGTHGSDAGAGTATHRRMPAAVPSPAAIRHSPIIPQPSSAARHPPPRFKTAFPALRQPTLFSFRLRNK